MSGTPKTLTTVECHRLLDALLFKDGTLTQVHRGIRNYAIALLLLDAGLRVSESIGLNVTDLVFNTAPVTSLLVRPEIAKNHKERQIPISTRLSEAISQMNKYYWSPLPSNVQHRAFYSGPSDRSLTRRQVHRIITSAALLSLGRSVHPHILRHTFASRLMRVTDMRTVQELLGHSNITSTQIYTHPNAEDKHKAIENMDRIDESPDTK